jgi:hypothetical protein
MALRLLKATVGAVSALLVLAAGAWAGGAFSRAEAAATSRPVRGSQPQQYPTRASDGEIPVGDSLLVNGQPMQLSIFVTADSPARVTEFYRQAFMNRGLLPIANADLEMGHVSVFDPEDGLQRFITAVSQPDGQTMVMLGVTNPRRAPRFTRGAKSMPFPVPEEQRGFLGYQSQDGSARAQNGQFASSLSVPAVLEWYRRALTAQGYSTNQRESSDSVAVFDKAASAGAPGSSLTVAAQALADKSGSMVFVNRVEGGVQ